MGFLFPPPENKVTSIINSIRKEKEAEEGHTAYKTCSNYLQKVPFSGNWPPNLP